MSSSQRQMWLVVGLLLLYFGIRIFNIDAIPLFIDESISIGRSVNIVNGTYIQHASTGKLLLPYYSILFQPDINTVYPLRLSVILLTCLSVVGTYAIARRYAGNMAGLIAILLMMFSPMLFLFDRFGLSDTLLHITLTLWVVALFKTFDRRKPSMVLAIISGVLFMVSMLAKAPTAFLAPLPLVFVIVLSRWSIPDRVRITAITYTTMLALWLPFAFVLSTRDIDYFGKSDHIAPSLEALFDMERIVNNLEFMVGGLITYHGIVLIGVAVVVSLIALRYKPRVIITLSAGVVGYGLAIVLLGGYGLFIRYYSPLLPMAFALFAIAVTTLIHHLPQAMHRSTNRLLWTGLIIWIVVASLPFINAIYTDPPNVTPIVSKDHSEYMKANSTGYAIPDLADYLDQLADDEPIVVEGAFVGCYTLDLYTPDDMNVQVQCPNVLSGDRRANYLNDYLPTESAQHDRYYVVLETQGIVNRDELTTIALDLIETFPRPGSGVIELYEVVESTSR